MRSRSCGGHGSGTTPLPSEPHAQLRRTAATRSARSSSLPGTAVTRTGIFSGPTLSVLLSDGQPFDCTKRTCPAEGVTHIRGAEHRLDLEFHLKSGAALRHATIPLRILRKNFEFGRLLRLRGRDLSVRHGDRHWGCHAPGPTSRLACRRWL